MEIDIFSAIESLTEDQFKMLRRRIRSIDEETINKLMMCPEEVTIDQRNEIRAILMEYGITSENLLNDESLNNLPWIIVSNTMDRIKKGHDHR